MRSLAYPLALALVLVAPLAALGLLAAAVAWVRWIVRAGGRLGVAGFTLTVVTIAAAGVPRSYRSTAGWLGLALVVGVTASAVVLRRSGRGDVGAGPAVPVR